MKRTSFMLVLLLVLVAPLVTLAGPKDDVGAATQAWVDGMNSHNAERVVALYDPEAVLWGRGLPRSVILLRPFVPTSRFSRPFHRRTRLS